jgi:DNA-binding NarL/FixJ family response regulator
MDKSPALRVLIVDDHPIVRSGLRLIEDLDPRLRVVGEAATGSAAITEARRTQPSVVLLDYRLPDGPGHEVCRQLKAEVPGVRVLFLSSYGDEATATAALDAGADGYLLKDNDAGKIVDAILTVSKGGLVMDPLIARAAVNRMLGGGAATATKSLLDRLTEQELKVLAEVAKGKADKEIAIALNLQAKTVRNYLAGVYKKLEVHTRTQAALLYERCQTKPGPP